MPPSLSGLMGNPFLQRLKQEALGLAEDFWKDGPDNLLSLNLPKLKKSRPGTIGDSEKGAAHTPPQAAETAPGDLRLWHAEPGEISEKMWGEGFVTPGGVTISGMLISPLGLTKEMNVLDLSAGLGGRMRHAAEDTGAYITGLEPDAAIAARGMALSIKAGKGKHAAIEHYIPGQLRLNRSYDCVIARETFYRVPDRQAFLAAIAQHAKPQAQIAFTDYILDPEHRDHPAVLAWKDYEKGSNPAGLVEFAAEWARVGFNLRVHEDLTDFYKTEIMVGMKRLMQFLASGPKPDDETRAAIMRRIGVWQHRVAAMEGGMKFYRFYGVKE